MRQETKKKSKGQYYQYSQNQVTGQYYCHNCYKYYKSSASLKVHQLVDCGKLRKFGCLYCKYVSRRKFDITRHMKRYCIHWVHTTGITPYQCTKCLKYFKSSKSRSNHRAVCGKDKKFGCAFCTYRSHQKANVLRHLTSQHPEANEINHLGLVFNSSL
ncbi:zinc finger protein 17-like [Leptopilina heterotoma]|uniref:zinc finger protein 17-like n=1 Tax=Leptopilina heterotoma TaxID=63436 RepID=UPI001CA8ED4E|nr:zinc finger protein 17-like [Leptopilina heterotoma]